MQRLVAQRPEELRLAMELLVGVWDLAGEYHVLLKARLPLWVMPERQSGEARLVAQRVGLVGSGALVLSG